jgi:hypothetical protein
MGLFNVLGPPQQNNYWVRNTRDGGANYMAGSAFGTLIGQAIQREQDRRTRVAERNSWVGNFKDDLRAAAMRYAVANPQEAPNPELQTLAARDGAAQIQGLSDDEREKLQPLANQQGGLSGGSQGVAPGITGQPANAGQAAAPQQTPYKGAFSKLTDPKLSADVLTVLDKYDRGEKLTKEDDKILAQARLTADDPYTRAQGYNHSLRLNGMSKEAADASTAKELSRQQYLEQKFKENQAKQALENYYKNPNPDTKEEAMAAIIMAMEPAAGIQYVLGEEAATKAFNRTLQRDEIQHGYNLENTKEASKYRGGGSRGGEKGIFKSEEFEAIMKGLEYFADLEAKGIELTPKQRETKEHLEDMRDSFYAVGFDWDITDKEQKEESGGGRQGDSAASPKGIGELRREENGLYDPPGKPITKISVGDILQRFAKWRENALKEREHSGEPTGRRIPRYK